MSGTQRCCTGILAIAGAKRSRIPLTEHLRAPLRETSADTEFEGGLAQCGTSLVEECRQAGILIRRPWERTGHIWVRISCERRQMLTNR